MRKALAVRNLPHPAGDPRVLEIQVAQVNALDALGRVDKASGLRGVIEPIPKASAAPYAAILRERLRTPKPANSGAAATVH